MPTKQNAVIKAKPSPFKKRTAKPKPAIGNIVTNHGSHFRSDGSLAPGKGKPDRKIGEEIVQTVIDGVQSAMESVGKFVQKVSSPSPRPKKLKTKPSIIPPFTPPI